MLEQLCGTNITSAQVSRAAALLDEELEAWRNPECLTPSDVEPVFADSRKPEEKQRFSNKIKQLEAAPNHVHGSLRVALR